MQDSHRQMTTERPAELEMVVWWWWWLFWRWRWLGDLVVAEISRLDVGCVWGGECLGGPSCAVGVKNITLMTERYRIVAP